MPQYNPWVFSRTRQVDLSKRPREAIVRAGRTLA